MEPFVEKSIYNLASISISFGTEIEANRGVSEGASHKFNSIRHGRETAEIAHSDDPMQCFNLSASLRRG